MDIRGFAGNAGQRLDMITTIHRSAPIIEQLLMGAEGSTIGYRKRSDGRVEPVLEHNPVPAEELPSKQYVQLGIERFQRLWIKFCEEKPAIARNLLDDRSGWCRMLHRFVDMPTADEARLIGDLHNDCNFGSTKVVRMCPPEEEECIRRMGAFDYYRFMRQRSTAVWPQGAVTRVDGGAILSFFSLHQETGYFEKMLAFSRKIQSEGIAELVVYGAGAVGRNLIRAARLTGISVLCAVDRNELMWGRRLDGIEVTSIDRALAQGNHCYAVASFAFTEEIEKTILSRYRDSRFMPRILIPT
jgi:hypothetical protein